VRAEDFGVMMLTIITMSKLSFQRDILDFSFCIHLSFVISKSNHHAAEVPFDSMIQTSGHLLIRQENVVVAQLESFLAVVDLYSEIMLAFAP
jgi:hypothetical protein